MVHAVLTSYIRLHLRDYGGWCIAHVIMPMIILAGA